MSVRPLTLIRIAMTSLFLLAITPAGAQVFKCVDSRGKTSFSDRPCESSSAEKVIEQRSRGELPSANKSADKRSGLGRFVDRAEQMSKRPGTRNDGK